jgi:hypothetical protein
MLKSTALYYLSVIYLPLLCSVGGIANVPRDFVQGHNVIDHFLPSQVPSNLYQHIEIITTVSSISRRYSMQSKEEAQKYPESDQIFRVHI